MFAGYDDGTTVWIAADTMKTAQHLCFVSSGKLVELTIPWRGPPDGDPSLRMVVGSAGPHTMHTWLTHLDPEQLVGRDWPARLLALAAAWMAWGKDMGHGEVLQGIWEMPGRLLLACPDGLFEIDDSGGIVGPQRYHAIGSGDEVAMGALYALTPVPVLAPTPGDGGRIVTAAAMAAVVHAQGCGGPVTFAQVERAEQP